MKRPTPPPASGKRTKDPERQRRANKYDKIVKENMIKALPGICQKHFHLRIVHFQPISVEFHHTRERKADFIGIVTLEGGKKVVLHIEFQLKDDQKMIYRQLDYKAMLVRKHPGLDILQFVIFLEKKAPKMPTELRQDDLFCRFHVLVLAGIDYHRFLESPHPEEILFAALADFGEEKPKVVMEAIIEKVKQQTHSGLDFQRYMSQL